MEAVHIACFCNFNTILHIFNYKMSIEIAN